MGVLEVEMACSRMRMRSLLLFSDHVLGYAMVMLGCSVIVGAK